MPPRQKPAGKRPTHAQVRAVQRWRRCKAATSYSPTPPLKVCLIASSDCQEWSHQRTCECRQAWTKYGEFCISPHPADLAVCPRMSWLEHERREFLIFSRSLSASAMFRHYATILMVLARDEYPVSLRQRSEGSRKARRTSRFCLVMYVHRRNLCADSCCHGRRLGSSSGREGRGRQGFWERTGCIRPKTLYDNITIYIYTAPQTNMTNGLATLPTPPPASSLPLIYKVRHSQEMD